MAEFLIFASVSVVLLLIFDVAALLWGADSRTDLPDAHGNASHVGIS